MIPEIKFRAWDKEFKRFVTFDPHISISLSGHIVNLQNGEGNDRYILVQYVGIKDKNGKEVYDGDKILMFRGKKNEYITKVIWAKFGFQLAENNTKLIDAMSLLAVKSYGEVIGHIFENQE